MEIRAIDHHDILDVEKVYEENPRYFNDVYGRVFNQSDLNEFFHDVPKNKTIEDKLLFGIYLEDECIGLIDLLKDYHRKNIWFIGLFMISENMHHQGLGQEAHQWIKNYVKIHGGKVLRLAVVDSNKSAFAFWKRMGYNRLKTTQPMAFDQKKQRIHLMELFDLNER
ncbi:MAG: GNAT family N-acetyltransferase [Clostridia bacterium]|nr:GNAT family N-acetyltransferase [Clostridia bacterium]